MMAHYIYNNNIEWNLMDFYASRRFYPMPDFSNEIDCSLQETPLATNCESKLKSKDDQFEETELILHYNCMGIGSKYVGRL